MSKSDLRTERIELKTHIFFNPYTFHDLEDIKTLLSSDFVIDFEDYDDIKKYVMPKVINDTLCGGGLNDRYVYYSFDQVDAIVILGSNNILPDGNIYGFALVNFDEAKNAIYIDVICSNKDVRGAGEILIRDIERMTNILLMNGIYLNSVKSAIKFYEKFGFKKHDDSCVDMCLMIKSLKKKKTKDAKGRKTNKHRISRRRRKRTHRK